MSKSWHLDRRTFLCGAGVSLALPLLEGMSWGAAAKPAAELPKRMCAVYFPFGVSLPGKDHEHADWNWFPRGQGKDFKFTRTLESLEPLRNDVTILSGLSHPEGRKMGGHDTGDIFLTAAGYKGSRYTNSISIDQLAARHIGTKTRFQSLTLSSDGGVGEPTRSTTLSFSRSGRPIPALSNPKQIFGRLFGREEGISAKAKRQQLEDSSSLLDRVLEHSKSLKRKLSKQDQKKFEEYLASVRDIEKRVERSRKWLDIPKPKVDPETLKLTASPKGPKEYLQTMYDLMFMAFQTDTTRVTTYMIGQVAGATTIANAFPAAIGLPGNWHGLAHGAGKKGGAERLGKFDQFLAQYLSYFLKRLADTPEGDGSLLDRTVVLYGSSNSRTHNNNNYPLLVAGGKSLGYKHGQHHVLSKNIPMSNVLVSMLRSVGVPVESFADSTGELSQMRA